jgi:integrase/recombinase XerD
MNPMPESMVTTSPSPETFSIKVLTRHSGECPKRDDPTFRKCNCRKQLYIYEHGKVRYVSAKTRSWTKAEDFMRQQIDARDPVKKALREIEEREAAKEAEKQSRQITVGAALDEWLAGLPKRSKSRTAQFNSMASKLKSWSAEQGIVNLGDIKPAMLYAWRGGWSPSAEKERDRLAPASQNLYVSHLHRFFKWTVQAECLDRDPSALVKRQKYERIQTHPLTSPEQFAEILAATYKLDADRYKLRDVPEYGRDLRAIFMLMRWTGIRIIDALMLKRTAVTDGRLNLTTKKTGKAIKDRPLPQSVIDAFNAIPVQPHVRDGYYFWSVSCEDEDNLTIVWTERIRRLKKYLVLKDEDGNLIDFHSHMLRDTFAVDLLMHGMPLEDVSYLLTHDSVKMTEKYYAPWVSKRRNKVHDDLQQALARMGAEFTV